MTEEHRYGDHEVREIFRAAAESDGSGGAAPEPGEGLTLSELQEIGREVGLSPERIAEAASALDVRPGPPPVRTHFGLPLSVGRSVDLPRAPTDAEWGMLVSELRSTFRARGRLGGGAGLREWSNGNLHACIEPTEAGYRLRLGTLKGNAVFLTRAGIGMIALAVVMGVGIVLTGDADVAVLLLTVFGGIGGAFLASGLLGLPGWARERARQMEHIAAHARTLIVAEGED